MKKFTILAALIFGISFVQSQRLYTVSDLEGTPYEDGSVHVYNVHGTFADPIDEAKLFFVLKNESESEIWTIGQIVSMTNADGQDAQFCIGGEFGNCYFPLTEGAYYPYTGFPIQPGQIQSLNDYFINLDGEGPVEYKFRFMEITEYMGEEIPGTAFTLTYRYDTEMGMSEVKSIAIAEVYPTLAQGYTNVDLKENAIAHVYNMNGKIVRTLNLQAGTSKIDLSGFASGVYMVQFKGVSGMNTTVKLVVK